jgi:hypothetical protein
MGRLKTGVKNMSSSNNRIILSVDPGKFSGIAVFTVTNGEEPLLVESGEYLQSDYAQPIRKVIGSAIMQNIELEIVCERFTINAQTVKNSQAPFSLEQIGILKQCMMDIGLDPESIIFQSPADAKAMFPNPQLKKLGYWHKGGEGHALDAIRHALLRLAKTGWKPVRLLEE